MALNKSGLPPMKNPMEAAVRPGGPGTVKPGSASPKPITLGGLGAPKFPKLANGGRTSRIPKMPKLPKIPKMPKIG